jgi:hypothetical protein
MPFETVRLRSRTPLPQPLQLPFLEALFEGRMPQRLQAIRRFSFDGIHCLKCSFFKDSFEFRE